MVAAILLLLPSSASLVTVAFDAEVESEPEVILIESSSNSSIDELEVSQRCVRTPDLLAIKLCYYCYMLKHYGNKFLNIIVALLNGRLLTKQFGPFFIILYSFNTQKINRMVSYKFQ